MELVDSWKNKKVFEKQLSLNLKELEGPYPVHWQSFIEFVKDLKIKKLLDVGCGCGTYSEICRKNFPFIEYTGIDYSQEAIEISRKQWPFGNFICMNYTDLTEDFVKNFDIINASSLHNVLPNGDECMEFLLNLNAKYISLGKIIVTEMPSKSSIYTAYDEIYTYLYQHNENSLKNMFKKYKYIYQEKRNNQSIDFILEKIYV